MKTVELENIYIGTILTFCENAAELGCPKDKEVDMWFRELPYEEQYKTETEKVQMKAYKIELLVLDFESVGQEDIVTLIEQIKYIHASVMNIQEKDIGNWHDDHPLNKTNTQKEEYSRLFSLS